MPGEPDNSSNDGGDNFQTVIKGDKLEERSLSRQSARYVLKKMRKIDFYNS